MFALSYSAPSQPDPNQRDNYFLGQATGFNQMAEVAEDRNTKRQIQQQQQRINLERQQEARMARQAAVQQQLAARQLDIAEKEAPIVAMQKLLSLQKTQAEVDAIRSNQRVQGNNNNFDQVVQGGINQYKQSTFNPIDTMNRSRTALDPRETQATSKRLATENLEQLAEPKRVETAMSRPEIAAIESLARNLPKSTASMLTRTGSTGVRERLKESQEMAQTSKQMGESMLSKPISFNLTTSGFGVRSGGRSPSYAFEDEVDWATL
jgi:hypothetical protein